MDDKIKGNIQFKVSVIIPVYNAERFLRKAVESCLIQEEVEEVILIDDGSSDRSLIICKELEKENDIIKLYQHPDKGNHNAATTRNLGVIKSKYKFIAFLDADDFYLPNRFINAKKLLIKDENTDGVYEATGSYAYDEVGEALQKKRMDEINIPELKGMTTLKEAVAPENLFEELLLGRKGWFHFNGLTIRKNVIKKVGLIDASLKRFGEDTEFFLRLALKSRLVSGELKIPVAMRGIYDGNLTLSIISTNEHDDMLIKYKQLFSKKLYNIVLTNNLNNNLNKHIIRMFLEDKFCEKKYKIFFKINYLFFMIIKKPNLITKLI